MKKYSNIDKERILSELDNTTKPQSTIAEEFGISVSTIQRWRKERDLEKNPPERKYYRLISKIGFAILMFAFVLAFFEKYIFSMIFILIGALSEIPESYYVFIKDRDMLIKNKKWSPYWAGKFIELIIITFFILLGIIFMIVRGR